MIDDKKIWGIHTLDDNLFLNKNLIAIGWKDFGDLTKVEGYREAFKEHYIKSILILKKDRFPPVWECFFGSYMRFRSVIMLYSRPR